MRQIQGNLFSLPSYLPEWINPDNWTTSRWRTAISRKKISVPLRICLETKLPEGDWLDFGCWRGDDVSNISLFRSNIYGFDPYWQPEFELLSRNWSVISCVYVLNVVETHNERIQVLRFIFERARNALIVAVRCDGSGEKLTNINTFQKYFTRMEFADFLEAVFPENEVNILRPGVAIIKK